MSTTDHVTRAAAGARSARAAVEASHRAIDRDRRAGIWIELVDRALALQRADDVDRRRGSGAPLPLAGTTLAVKGNIDVEGLDTTAGCPTYARRAASSAPVVQALVDAGTVVIGVTNMDQFATGLVGTRSPFGVCPNAHWDGLVSGGSSSGSGVAVATGMVDLALGTDTAGSGRVPAAANGIVGIKPTRGRVSLCGVVPACASLDCVSVFSADVHLAALAVAVAAAAGPDGDPWRRRPVPTRPPTAPLRVGIAGRADLDFDGDERSAVGHEQAIDALVRALPPSARATELPGADVEHLVATGRLLYEGAFVAERYASVGGFIEEHPGDVDPVVGSIITAAGRLPAWRLAADHERLAAARQRAAAIFDAFDVVVLPTVPRVPTVEQVRAEPVAVNSMLGTYTNFVNLLDLAAVTLPVPAGADPRRPPASVSLIGPAWTDDTLVSLAGSILGQLATRPPR